MLFWLFAITITVVACAALYYAAAGRMVNAAGASGLDATRAHFRRQLGEIDADAAFGRMEPAEVVAAKAELARELIRQQKDASAAAGTAIAAGRLALPASIVAAALIAFLAYAWLGRPDLPSQPLAGRAVAKAEDMSVADAVKAVEDRLAAHPDDLKGWSVIAPVYMQSGQYAKAERAFRQILALSPETADADTDLAEALMMQNGGQATGEAATLLHKAVTLDPRQVRARFYLAAEAMRQKDYGSAVSQWNDIIALGSDADSWMPTARAGLAAAEAGRDGKPLPDANAAAAPAQSPAILAMVDGLAARLQKNGGSLAEWTQLVRSEIVLGDLVKAQAAYNSAKKAYPDAGDRQELDGLAAQAGLKLDGTTP
jgi:cytochrome c-type biogenesis protein CcmH